MSEVRSVPFFDYQIFEKRYGKKLIDVIKNVVSRGAFILQKDLDNFENRIAKYLGTKHAIGVANCTDGLILALEASGLKSGDEVILPSHTFIATASAVYRLGGIPVPIECGKDHMMDVDCMEKVISSKTTTIMPVQLNGRTCQMDAVLDIAKKHGLNVIEDAAQALGSKYKDKFAGTFGKAAAFSFYPAKILGCFGDGGIVVTNDDDIADKIYQLHEHGRDKNGEIKSWGYNSRLDNLQAAILNFIFDEYDEIIARRRHVASLYQKYLLPVESLLLPPGPDCSDHFDVYQNYEIEAENRDELQDYLKSVGIGTLRQWGGMAVHQHKVLGFDVVLPQTEQMITKELMIPMNMSVTDDDILYVSNHIKKFYSK
ncbi:MAG: DegT/DnrJ/EryC1/StrS family aminotransferase [Pseudomonadota bacterium]